MQPLTKKVLTLVLTIVALAVGQSAWAMSSFTVSSPQDNNTFRITRTGNTTVAETIDWRVVSLSAIAGVHFTGYQGNYSGTVTFAADEPYKDVTISENTPGNNAYKYQNGSTRSYRFEVIDKDGSILASKDRTMTTGTSVPSSGLFNEKEITIYTSEVQYSDAGYDQPNNPHYINSSSYYNLSGIAPVAYYTLIGAQLRSTISLDAKEKNNGYQYIQVLINNTSTCDNRSNCSNGDPGNINLSRYMAGFDHEPSSANTTYAAYTFPVTSQPNNCSEVSNAWSNGVTNKLYTQKFNTNCRATDGRLILPLDFEKFVVRFNASGGGTDKDEWYAKNVKAHIQAVDGTAPTVLNNYKVSGGRHQKGAIIYVTVPFSEIVEVEGTPRLNTSWGNFDYYAGSGTNVLTFRGEISSTADGTLYASGIGTSIGTSAVRDLAGNNFTPFTHDFGTALDTDYAWTTADFNSLGGSEYEIASKIDLRHLALLVNKAKNPCTGLTFQQTQDITCDNTYTPIGYHVSNSDEATFRGTYDGQSHTVSGITVTRTGDTNADGHVGLFGYIRYYSASDYGTVRNVVLASSTFTGKNEVGGIVGYNYGGTVQNCRVESTVTIKAGHNNAYYHGGIVGENSSTNAKVIGCYSAAVVSVNGKNSSRNFGGIVGYNIYGTVKDCLYAGTTVDADLHKGAIIGYDDDNDGVFSNNYYTAINLGGVNSSDRDGARRARTVTLGEDIALVGDETAYSASGLTAIGTTALQSGETIYSGEGQTLTFSYTGDVPVGFVAPCYYTIDDTPIGGSTFQMPAKDAVHVGTLWTTDYETSHAGTAADPYIISDYPQLELLALRMNEGEYYYSSSKHFKLGADIACFDGENNHTPIGTSSNSFRGTFDGDGHTISGIRINTSANYQGLFGYLGSESSTMVKNVTLTNSTITGQYFVGGIVGNCFIGTIQNCRVESSVTIGAYADNANNHGGIVGTAFNYTTVKGCYSAATVTNNGKSNCKYYGGIVGYINNSDGNTVKNCLCTGTTIESDSNKGAIVGSNNNNDALANNYYYNCTVSGATTNIGTGDGDQDGARQARTVTLGENIALSGTQTAYDVSGLTAIGTTALSYNDGNTTTIYSGEGQTVSLTHADREGYTFSGFTTTAGTIDGSTLTMPASDVTVSSEFSVIDFADDGHSGDSEADAYIIYNKDQLDMLATRVNSGDNYSYQKFFKLGADITYDGTENNYTPIGTSSNSFRGTFDGDGHTVSGIRINTSADYQGLFGYLGGSGIVKNVTLTNSTITANDRVGGIAGYNGGHTVQNCRVESTVTIGAYSSAYYHGGIVGINDSQIIGSISSATVSHNGHTGCSYFGAIAGSNNSTIRECLAIGATVSAYSYRGVIAGRNSGTLANNYYYNCTVSVATTNIGTGISGINTIDVSDNDGAVQASAILSETETVPTVLSGTVVFRREFTGGKASTVIFPFAHEKGTEGTYYTFSGVAYDGVEGKWKATMTEHEGSTLTANTPYLFVPAGTEAHAPVLFHGTAGYDAAGTTDVTDWSFKGVYETKTWTAGDVGNDYGFAATSGKAVDGVTDVNAGDFVKLAAGAWIRPMRSYLTYTGGGNPFAGARRSATADLPSRISVILVSANGETTEISDALRLNDKGQMTNDNFYDLQGRKIEKPTKGLYIHNGKKVLLP